MKRREFITLVGGAVATWPLAARAQQPGRMRLVAVEMALAEGDKDGERLAAALEQALAQLGWKVGQNLRLEYRWNATNQERAEALAAELVSLKPDVIVSHATIVTKAFAQRSGTIPVVFVNVSDPIGEQFVKSFGSPGGNFTGFTNIEPSMGGKYLQLLKEIAPNVNRAAMIFNPNSTPGGGTYFADSFDAAGPTLSIKPIKTAVQNVADIEAATKALAGGGGGVVVIGEPFTNLHRSDILRLAAQYNLPAICPYRLYAAEGCLMSYGVDFASQFQRAATYVDRILKGEKPGDLPVQSPTKFELAINLKTAKALGLMVSPTLLVRADEVIE
jgi:ABC-type uncharacterized transport system substrate-binding protein